MRVEKSRIKVDLLIACRYKLSRPVKADKRSEGLDRFYTYKLDVTRNKSYLDVYIILHVFLQSSDL